MTKSIGRPEWGVCSFETCDRYVSVKRLQLCSAHYHQSRRGELKPTVDSWTSLSQKVEYYVDKPEGDSGCWLWTRSKTPRGYGHVCWEGKVLIVHRSYLKDLGWDVPDGMDVDHLCRVTSCVNPAHLEVVTHQVNTQRGEVGTWDRGQFCKRGHEFTPENTYINKRGHRCCRSCHREHNNRRVVCETCGVETSSGNIAAHSRLHEGRY